ncbi:MAG: U32 family peptidase [Gammaproteobacteria bacterium]|nr:U32 family peptidase [Gammaproteobacteria bacterium]
MKVTAPISRLEEIERLAAAGVDEIYCGVVPDEWIARFNSGAVNRRLFGNLRGLDALREAIDLAHRHDRSLFLVLNAPHYGAAHQRALLDLARRFRDDGGDAVIVADAGLVAELHERVPDLRVHLSSVAGCRNSAAVEFYRELGVHRVILPRDITLGEIAAICANAHGVEIEAFVLNDGCVFEEGLCHSIHLPTSLGGPICLDRRAQRYVGRHDREIPARLRAELDANDADYRDWLWYRFGCGFATTPDGHPYGPCGLCAVPELAAAGLASVKIAGRERSTAQKVASVRMVRAVVDRTLRREDREAVRRHAVSIRGVEDRCRAGYMCYYPEVRAGVV